MERERQLGLDPVRVVTAQNDPALLETFTTTGFAEFRSSGSAASVTRTIPTDGLRGPAHRGHRAGHCGRRQVRARPGRGPAAGISQNDMMR